VRWQAFRVETAPVDVAQAVGAQRHGGAKSKTLPLGEEATQLTPPSAAPKLSAMLRLASAFLVVLLASRGTQAQHLPGRDLFDLPIAALAEGTALAFFAGDGLRNPASLFVSDSQRARLSLSSLSTGREQRVSAQTVAVAYHVRGTAFGLSLARSGVSDIARTNTDPQTVGPDIPYGLSVISVAAARRDGANLTSGVALRYQAGELDSERRQEFGFDAGVVLDSVIGRDITVAASSYLWRPGALTGSQSTGAAFSGGIEATALRWPAARTRVRAGYAFTGARASAEHFGYVTARTSVWDARIGVARLATSSDRSTRLRIALGAREENPYGLSPSYVFMLVTHLAAA
jgi:hypothetical protein